MEMKPAYLTFALLVFVAALIAGCGHSEYNYSTTGDPIPSVAIQYTPQECVKTPWQAWYQSGDGGSSLINDTAGIAPLTDEQLIAIYYSKLYDIGLAQVHRQSVQYPQLRACHYENDTCISCPVNEYFTAYILESDAQKLIDLGWTPVEKSNPVSGTGPAAKQTGCAMWHNTDDNQLGCFKIGVMPLGNWTNYEPPEQKQGVASIPYVCFIDSDGNCQLAQ